MGDATARLRLRVSPGSSRPAVVGRLGAAWKVRVAAPAERGRANAAVVDLLAEALSIPPADLELVAGGASRDKVLLVHGLDDAEAETRLARAAGSSR